MCEVEVDTVCVLSQRCFTLMDRGFTFKLISNYVNMITNSDNKVAQSVWTQMPKLCMYTCRHKCMAAAWRWPSLYSQF